MMPTPPTSPSAFPVPDLPRDELSIVIANVKGKNPLRLVSRSARDIVDSIVTSLNCDRRQIKDGLVWEPQLIARLPRLRKVYIAFSYSGVSDLSPLSACSSLQALSCSFTSVSSLEPLSACTALTKLDCSETSVASLAPLATCTALYELICSDTDVSSLEPLTACTALAILFCNNTAISSLAPLSACAALTDLNCSDTAVSSLEPLTACKALTELNCIRTAISSLAPILSCPALRDLVCSRDLFRNIAYRTGVRATFDESDDEMTDEEGMGIESSDSIGILDYYRCAHDVPRHDDDDDDYYYYHDHIWLAH